MPWFQQPKLRALNEAAELAGVIKPLNTAGVQRQLDAEAAGQKKKLVPVQTTYVITGKSYTAK